MGVRKRIRPTGYGLDFSLRSRVYASQNSITRFTQNLNLCKSLSSGGTIQSRQNLDQLTLSEELNN